MFTPAEKNSYKFFEYVAVKQTGNMVENS